MAARSNNATSKPAQGTVQVDFVALTGQQPEKPYRQNTARALYWQDAVARLSKEPAPLATLHKAWGDAKSAPKLPKSGKVEPPQGWVAYFQRCGLVAITYKAVPATQVKQA